MIIIEMISKLRLLNWMFQLNNSWRKGSFHLHFINYLLSEIKYHFWMMKIAHFTNLSQFLIQNSWIRLNWEKSTRNGRKPGIRVSIKSLNNKDEVNNSIFSFCCIFESFHFCTKNSDWEFPIIVRNCWKQAQEDGLLLRKLIKKQTPNQSNLEM
jgi:hypothetical protein